MGRADIARPGQIPRLRRMSSMSFRSSSTGWPLRGAFAAFAAFGAASPGTGTGVLAWVMTQARTPVPVPGEAAPKAAKAAKAPRKGQPVDDDLKDIEDILRKRGI